VTTIASGQVDPSAAGDTDLAILARAGERLCGRAAKVSAAPPMAERSNLELLLDEDVSFDRAMGIVADRQLRGNPAAQSTVDALMYSLRSGCAALSRRDVQQRLTAVDEEQLRDICTLLQKRNPNIAKPWPAGEIEKLVMTWATCHG
jgi:hypothetical protein